MHYFEFKYPKELPKECCENCRYFKEIKHLHKTNPERFIVEYYCYRFPKTEGILKDHWCGEYKEG